MPPVERHNEPTILFVTVCTAAKRDVLASSAAHEALRTAWHEARAWRVGDYVMLPDHVHLFCVPGEWPARPIQKWVRYWKRLAGNLRPDLKRQWQQDCWDTQMRDQDHYVEKLSYVRMNPVRRGLCAEPGEWPYQGRVFPIEW